MWMGWDGMGWVQVNEAGWDLTRPLEADCKLKLVDFDSKEGSHTFWHSSAHILGRRTPSSVFARCVCCI
jgi:hypothetical protein